MENLGPLEMKILGLIDEDEHVSVGELQERLRKVNEELAYTTVMTVVSRLFEKGVLSRRKESRAYLYSKGKRFKSGAGGFLAKVQNTLFRNDRLRPFLALLDGPSALSEDELKELKKKVDERLKKMKADHE